MTYDIDKLDGYQLIDSLYDLVIHKSLIRNQFMKNIEKIVKYFEKNKNILDEKINDIKNIEIKYGFNFYEFIYQIQNSNNTHENFDEENYRHKVRLYLNQITLDLQIKYKELIKTIKIFKYTFDDCLKSEIRIEEKINFFSNLREKYLLLSSFLESYNTNYNIYESYIKNIHLETMKVYTEILNNIENTKLRLNQLNMIQQIAITNILVEENNELEDKMDFIIHIINNSKTNLIEIIREEFSRFLHLSISNETIANNIELLKNKFKELDEEIIISYYKAEVKYSFLNGINHASLALEFGITIELCFKEYNL